MPPITDEDKLPWLDAFGVVVATCMRPEVYTKVRKGMYAHMRNPLAGCCYAASEALYHLSQDPLEGMWLRYGEAPEKTHWYLRAAWNPKLIIDPTASQFPISNFRDGVRHWDGSGDLDSIYDLGKRRGFMTKHPSKRAQVILDAIDRTSLFRWKT